MKVIVIVAHPNKTSFNHAIALTCSQTLTDNGHEVIAHDLYEERAHVPRLGKPVRRIGYQFSKGSIFFIEKWRIIAYVI